MSKRLYYTDAYVHQFNANVVAHLKERDRTAVVLDETYFYPTSGGQPCDRGHINGVPVVDVTIRLQDGAVLHWLEGTVADGAATAVIDWQRRFDHMQQHTGQHILSQAFISVAEAQTASFHLSTATVTIDLDTPEITAAQATQVETLANQIIWQNRPVHIRIVTPEEAQELPLRKIPPLAREKLRLVEIDQFDLTACGGTHVAYTGEVGLLKITKLERRGEQVRVEFRCGQRALQDYRQKNDIVDELVAALTTGPSEIATAVTRLQEEAKETRRAMRNLQTQLAEMEVDRLLQNGTRHGDITLITHIFKERDAAQVRSLAQQLTQRSGVVALLGMATPRLLLIFCRSADAPGQMNQLLQSALQHFDSAGGGGSATFAQGGGAASSETVVRQVILQTESELLRDMN